MKKWINILIVFVVLILAAIACRAAYIYGYGQGLVVGQVAPIWAEASAINDHMILQFKNAECEGVQKAIMANIQVLDKHYGMENSRLGENTYNGQKMLSLVRLSRVESKLGNKKSAKQHMVNAIELCARLNWKDCSEEQLISVAKRLAPEKENPIACLANE